MKINRIIKQGISHTNHLFSYLERNWDLFIDTNSMSFLLILLHGTILTFFLHTIIAGNPLNSFLSFRFFIILLFSCTIYLTIWIIYSLTISILMLDILYRVSFYRTLKYDSFSYLPLTILILIGLVLYYYDILSNFPSWFIFIGLFLLVFSKIILFILKPPNDESTLAWINKTKVMGNITNLDADTCITTMFKVKADSQVRKYMVKDELRNAINLKGIKNGKLKFTNDSSFDLLQYSIGWTSKNKQSEGNLKLFLINDKSKKSIFNKNASNILPGWNEYQVSLFNHTKTVEIEWENSIMNDVFLSISNLSPVKTEKERKNIIVIVFDGLMAETIGLYRGDAKADNISNFFKNSLIFTNAYVQGEWTMPNLVSMTTSLYQSHHGIIDPDLYSKEMSRKNKTLAEILQENGYNTFAYISSQRVSPGYGHARGYNRCLYKQIQQNDKYDNLDITLSALKYLRENKKTNNFLFLHYFDSHPTYFPSPGNISSEKEAVLNMNLDTTHYSRSMKDESIFIREFYLQKYKEMDENILILFDYIRKYEKNHTTVIFTSDHGVPIHGIDLFNTNDNNHRITRKIIADNDDTKKHLEEPTIRVPFLIYLPKHSNKNLELISDPIDANLTLMPTVLEIAGLGISKEIDGVSIFTKNTDGMIGKGYAISELIYKNDYELFIKTPDFIYILKTGRNRADGKIQKNANQEFLFDSNGVSITDEMYIKESKNKVKKILKDNKLPDVITEIGRKN